MSPRPEHPLRLAVVLLSVATVAACSDSTPASGAAPQPGPQPAAQQAAQPVVQQAAPPAAPPAALQVAKTGDALVAAAPAPAPKPMAKAAAAAQPSRAQADAMSAAELRQRRDLWPARVAFKKVARLDATTTWKAGDELPLNVWDGANVVLDEGSFLFEWPAEETDVVERTRDVAASMSADALALTIDSLRARPEVWPTRVRVTVPLQLAGNTVIPAGREVAVRFFEGDQMSVYDRDVANYYTVAPNETDLMSRARERLALPEAERVPFFIRSLEASLDPAAGKATLADADFVLVYSGRLGCPRCAAFAPQLKEFYARAKASAPAGSRFEVVFLSNDPDAASAGKYVAQAGLPGGVIAFDRRLEAANLMALPLQTLPGLFVFDRAGNLVDRNHPDAGSPSAGDVLAKFEAHVKAGPQPR